MGWLGWPAQRVVGQHVLAFVHPADRPAASERLAARLGGVTSPPYELRLVHRDGQAVPALARTGPRLVDGKIVGGGGALVDRSALVHLAEERDLALAAQARLEGAIRTGRMVAHELAGPLGVASLLLDFTLTNSAVPAVVAADLRTVAAELERAAEVLGRLKTLVRYAEEETPAGPQLALTRASTAEGKAAG